jgi:alanine racemase
LKYNTGLNRIGFLPNEFDWILNSLSNSPFNLKSVYSHLAASEEKKPNEISDKQISIFKIIVKKHKDSNHNYGMFHLLNSSGIYNYNEFQMDAVRSGTALHGYSNNIKWDKKLLPIASLSSSIIQIYKIKKGESVGYNNGWIASKNSKIFTSFGSCRWNSKVIWNEESLV